MTKRLRSSHNEEHEVSQFVNGWDSSVYLPVALFALGLILRLGGIDAHSLAGDEFGSLDEARSLGLNWNGIGYAVILHFWLFLGSSEFLLRLPSAIFGALTIPVMFEMGRLLGGNRLGFAVALLCAFSPFNIAHAQEVRFYSLFSLATALCMWTFMKFQLGRRSGAERVSLCLSAILVVVSHFLGIAVVAILASSFVLSFQRRRVVILLILAGCVGITLLLLYPPLLNVLWAFYRAHANASSVSTVEIVPISLVTFAKIGFSLFNFAFGYEVYPLWLWLVLPGGLVFLGLSWKGCRWARKNQVLWTPLVLATMVFLAAFLVLDPIGGRVASGVSSRHVAFFWPFLMTVIAAGVANAGRWYWPFLLLGIGLNLSSLFCRWEGVWSSNPVGGWHETMAFIKPSLDSGSCLVYDGRSAGGIRFYGDPSWTSISTWDLEHGNTDSLLSRWDRIVYLSTDWQNSRRAELTALLNRLQSGRSLVSAYVRYPSFHYVLERQPKEMSSSMKNGFEMLNLPLELYDLRFQDLCLPVSVEGLPDSIMVVGMNGIPTLSGSDSLVIPVRSSRNPLEVLLLSNVSDCIPSERGGRIGTLSAIRNGLTVWSGSIGMGTESDDWMTGKPQFDTTLPVIAASWHKRIHLVGRNTYNGAWKDGTGVVYCASLRINSPVSITSFVVSRSKVHKEGRLNIWGLAVKWQ